MDKKLKNAVKKMTTKTYREWDGAGGAVKASKKNSTWLWLIKIFYTIKKKRSESI